MRTLSVDDRPTRLAQAVAELGRIDKTIHSKEPVATESHGGRLSLICKVAAEESDTQKRG
jgi:Tn3 transposase DDE domain